VVVAVAAAGVLWGGEVVSGYGSGAVVVEVQVAAVEG